MSDSESSVSKAVLALVALLGPWLCLTEAGAAAIDKSGVIAEFADNNCMDCHDADTEKGGFSIEQIFNQELDAEQRAKLLTKILEKVEHAEMPTKEDAEFFASADTKKFKKGAHDELLGYYDRKRQHRLGSLRRLKSDQYVNTMQDLFGYPLRDIEQLVPTDLRNSRDPSEITHYHLDRYVQSAEIVLDYVLNRQPGKEATLLLNHENFYKSHPSIRRAQAPLSPKTGLLLVGSRAGRFSSSAEVTSFPLKASGLYRVRARVLAHREPTAFRIAARTEAPNNQVSGLRGSRPVHSGQANTKRFVDVELEAHFVAGEKVAVQKTSLTKGPGNYRRYDKKKLTGSGLWVHSLEVTGPLNKEIVATRQAILGDHPANRAGAEKIIAGLLPRAFRSPSKPKDTAPFLAVYDRDLAVSKDHHHALREALKSVLVASRFLYRNGGTGPLNDHEIATRLSYFLWSSMPDAKLFALADAGKLQDPTVRAEQVTRMLEDKKAERFLRDFTDYWLELYRVGETKPNFRTKPAYDGVLEEDIRTEARLFFREVLYQDLDVANFLDSDWTMLNENMATLYQLTGRKITGSQFRKVSLKPGDRRGGLIGQSAFACLTSNGTQTQPILRGVWILKNLLNRNLEPPKNVEPIETDSRGAATVLDQIRAHRNAKACRSCHEKIDPLGVALEHYGVVGNWRATYRNKNSIEVTVKEYSNLSGMPGVKAYLLQHQNEFKLSLINRLKEYALGRDITYYDLTRSRELAKNGKTGLLTLVKAIAADESFVVR